MISLKHHDRKINMPMTFVVENIYMRWKTRTCSRKYPLHLVKFADSGYYAFSFSQLVFKIMKLVSLKMVTNIYRDLRSECVSEYP